MSNPTEVTRPVVVRCVFCDTANRVDLAKLAAGPKCGNCGKPIRLDRPLKVSDASFEQTIKEASVPVLVDFYADWCGPCRVMAPTLDDFAKRRAGEVLVLKMDTDANQLTAGRFGIRGIPTLILFKNGEAVKKVIGAYPKRKLEAELEPALA